MGSKDNKKKKAKASTRNTGRRKIKKKPDPSPPPLPRPQPRPLTLRVPARAAAAAPQPEPSNTPAEADAVAALVAMGGPSAAQQRKEYEHCMDQIFVATVPGVSAEDLGGDSDEKDGSGSDSHEEDENSDSSIGSDSDNDQLEDIGTAIESAQYLLFSPLAGLVPVSSPARDAQARKNKFIIPFEVPYNGASRELEVDSLTPFDTFLDQLANTMSTRKSLLSGIAYIPSYQPKTPKPIPKLLENAAAWKKLIEGVGVHIETAKAKNKGKGVPKPFSIQIVDTSGGEPKTVVGGKKNKKDKSAAAEPDVGEKKEHQFYRQLEQKYHCAEHDKPCAVLSDGTHYHLTDNDLAKWAYLISNHRATAEQLPRNELKIDDAAPRQHTAKKAIARGGLAALDSSEPPVWIQQMLPLMGLAMGGVMRNNLNAAPFETPRSAAPPPETPGPSRQSARDLDPPSSGTKRSAAMTAPTMDMWLRSLDNDHEGRGRHNLQFYGYSLKFEDNGMYDLTDMENMDIDTLSLLIGAPRGVAARLIKYATEDLEKLTNAAKRARHA